MKTLFSKNLFYAIILLLAGFIIGIFIPKFDTSCNSSDYKYINPDFICKDNLIIKKNSYVFLKSKLNEFIQEQKDNKNILDVAIYFRDLQNGPTLGINEHENFSPASLLKLPLLLTYEKLQNESIPTLFDISIMAKDTNNNTLQNIIPSKSIEYGKQYLISDLLSYMIKYSDNKSYVVLLDYLHQIYPDKDLLKETFVELGIVDPKDLLDNTISVKSYGSIFIQLYNSSFFNQNKISEEILNLLTNVEWKNGINRGVPADIKVAHKFGERSSDVNNIEQLHDCGIIYYPNNPYLLCIMTRGTDQTKLAKTISEISKMFYEEFDSRKL
ncbi:MAG: serine hydrolase [Candidatus Nomurabacteria bacterium]|nr:serine hydrolase [Candidatus Nomurabacteria bacterium]